MHKIRSSGISVNKPKSLLYLNEFILNFPRGLDGGTYFSKDQGLNRKRTKIILNWIGWRVDFEKHQGLLCKMCGPGAMACVSANAGADISGHMACCSWLGPPLCTWTGTTSAVGRVYCPTGGPVTYPKVYYLIVTTCSRSNGARTSKAVARRGRSP
jgi:hypothetical protein